MLPATVTTSPDIRASMGTSTVRVTPCSISSPVAVAVKVSPSAGSAPSSMGLVSLNVASGNCDVSIAWRRSWPSRRSSSLLSVCRLAVTSTLVIWVPDRASVPDTSGVRPTAVLARLPARVSSTR